jgi:alpha-galactosidase
MDAATRDLLTNPDVLAIDQDPLGIQGHRIKQEGPVEVWMKLLKDGSAAVGLFNRGWGANLVTVDFRDVGLGNSVMARDLWAKKDLGPFQEKYTAIVPQHGVVMIKVKRGT